MQCLVSVARSLRMWGLGVLVGAATWGVTQESAHADVFVWKDPETGLQASFPDTWKRVINPDVDVLLHLMIPSGGDEAACLLRTQKDSRFLVYPVRYGSAVQQVAYGHSFWPDYLAGAFEEPEIGYMRDLSGLGRGYAGLAYARYTVPGPEPVIRKKGILFASLYEDTVFVAECSAYEERYDHWHKDFLSFIKTVDFQKTYHEIPVGHYRNFIGEHVRLYREEDCPIPCHQ